MTGRACELLCLYLRSLPREDVVQWWGPVACLIRIIAAQLRKKGKRRIFAYAIPR